MNIQVTEAFPAEINVRDCLDYMWARWPHSPCLRPDRLTVFTETILALRVQLAQLGNQCDALILKLLLFML